MNAINRLDLLLSDVFKTTPIEYSHTMNQRTSSTRPLFREHDSRPTAVLPAAAPLPPRRDASSMKHHRRRYRVDSNDLFRALTLECEQYLAAAPSYHNKTYGQIIVQPPLSKPTAAESNDDDYENLHPTRLSAAIKTNVSPLKTSIEVMSPKKRHVVSITVSSKITAPPPAVSPTQPSPPSPSPTPTPTPATPPVAPPFCRSSEDEPTNPPSSNTNRRRRRRTRKQLISSSTTRSSSSSTERKEKPVEKRPLSSKRSSSTDPRHHRPKTSSDNYILSLPSSQKPCPKRPHRRDVSLQHPRRYHENHASPLSVLLTSTKPTSDFLTNSQQRRSRLESLDHKPLPLFYRPSPTRNNNHHHHPNKSKNNNNNNSNIPTHRIPSYPVY